MLLTFDYELFLGKKSGSADNCILKPTEMVLDVLKEYRLTKAIFFVDTVYMFMLESRTEGPARLDLERIMDQLVDIVKNGHFIFPHIHPHWMDASYDRNENQWQLKSLQQYRFHNITPEKRKRLFDYSIDLIKRIQDKAGIHYHVSGYRAGGWCIQPFSDFMPYFAEHGISHDFSALKHSRFSSDAIYYDFTKAPKKTFTASKTMWQWKQSKAASLNIPSRI